MLARNNSGRKLECLNREVCSLCERAEILKPGWEVVPELPNSRCPLTTITKLAKYVVYFVPIAILVSDAFSTMRHDYNPQFGT